MEVKSHSSGNMLAEQNVSQLLQRGKKSDSVPFHSCSKLSICVICREERSIKEVKRILYNKNQEKCNILVKNNSNGFEHKCCHVLEYYLKIEKAWIEH